MSDVPPPRRPLDPLRRALGAQNAAVLAVLILVVLWGVASRYLLGAQARWSEESARMLLVWLSVMGAAQAFGSASHLGMDVLVAKFHPRVAASVARFNLLLVVVFGLGLLAYGGGRFCLSTFQLGQHLVTLPLAKGWVYTCLPLAGLCITAFAVEEFFLPRTPNMEGARDV
jgi:TRAP-type C4-dicarboxylate transport system permease small subunit